MVLLKKISQSVLITWKWKIIPGQIIEVDSKEVNMYLDHWFEILNWTALKKDDELMNITELKQKLTELWITFNKKAKRDELQTLLDEFLAKNPVDNKTVENLLD